MRIRIPADVRAAMAEIARKIGSARRARQQPKNMTPEERSERARKAAMAAAKKRTADRLARERAAKRTPERGKAK